MVIWLDPNFPRDTRPATVTASQSHPHKYIAISLHKYKLVVKQIHWNSNWSTHHLQYIGIVLDYIELILTVGKAYFSP